MLSDIYYRKKLGFPYFSIVFIACCLLVTVPTYFFPNLNYVLGGTKNKYYIWQYLTLIFQHGSYNVPIIFHLLTNVVIISFFGIIVERVLGAKKFLTLNLFSIITFYISLFYMNGLYGNGGSGIIWSYTSITVYIVFILWRNNKKQLSKEILFYVFIILIIYSWVFITISDFIIHEGLSVGIKSHLISVILGFFFCFLWKDFIKKRIEDIPKGKHKIQEKNILYYKIAVLSLPIIIISILISSYFGLNTKHISSANIKNIVPTNSIEEINKKDSKIIIEFDYPMEKKLKESSLYSISQNNYFEKLSIDIIWENNKTIIIKFNRIIYKDEKIKIVLGGLKDINGLIIKDKIILEYGYIYK